MASVLPYILSENILAKFTAEVELTNWESQTPDEMGVLMDEERLVFTADDAKRSVALKDIFDISQDVSSKPTPGSTETVSIAFEVGEMREVASITGPAKNLIQFQKVLYKKLLTDMKVLVKHRPETHSKYTVAGKRKLRITSTDIQFDGLDDNAGSNLAIVRDEITEFKTANRTFDGDKAQPVMTIYSVKSDIPQKTVICLPSFRFLNLFGRFLQSPLSVETPEEQSKSSRGIHLLLVDDDEDDLEMAQLFLQQQSEEFSITLARSAAAGMKILEGDDAIDCVVSDYSMPEIDGLQFLHKVRERYPELPFILFTGQGSEKIAKQAILDDVTDYIEKDIGTEQYKVLAKRVKKALQ